MNEALLRARKAMQGQVATLKQESGFDDSPYVLGDHTAEITASEIREHRKNSRPVHYVQMRLHGGEDDGRIAFLYPARYLDNAEDLIRSATDIRKIMGEDAIPGTESDDGFEVDLAAMLEDFEEIASSLIGEWLTVRCVNSKSTKDDGTPWQNWYVQRGLGDDRPAAEAAAEKKPATRKRTASSSMKVAKKKKKPTKRKKQKITKKKR